MISKYNSVRTNGYHSKREAARAAELRLLEKAGAIRFLQEQVRWELIPKQDGERAVHLVIDFQYEEAGELVLEDVKSPITKTPVYVVKRKLLLFRHGIRIRETM